MSVDLFCAEFYAVNYCFFFSYPGVAYKPQPRTKADLGDHHSESGKKDYV